MATSNWQAAEILVEAETRTSEEKKELYKDLYTHPLDSGRETIEHFPKSVSQPVEVLQRARDLIASGWTQRTLAVDEQGVSVEPHSERAVKWCVIGAMQAAVHYEPTSVPHNYMMKYMQSLWNAANLNWMIDVEKGDIPQVNDWKVKAQEQIVKMFDKTIAHVFKHPEANKWNPR